MKTLLQSATALALMAGTFSPALAADAIDYTPMTNYSDVSPERFGWGGLYGGVQLGYGFGDVDPGDSAHGFLGGVHAGYLFEYGRFVVGPEFDIDYSAVDGDDYEMSAIARAKLRAGYTFDQIMVSGMVGYGYSWADNDGDVDLDGGGLLLGAGVDYAITNDWVAGADYIYHNFEDLGDTTADIGLHTVRARLSYKF